MAPKQKRMLRVAGIHVPAFVERTRRRIALSSTSSVSPGFTSRPSLSGERRVARVRGPRGVAGIHVPAFVERAEPSSR